MLGPDVVAPLIKHDDGELVAVMVIFRGMPGPERRANRNAAKRWRREGARGAGVGLGSRAESSRRRRVGGDSMTFGRGLKTPARAPSVDASRVLRAAALAKVRVRPCGLAQKQQRRRDWCVSLSSRILSSHAGAC
jgi:hypothetical protein